MSRKNNPLNKSIRRKKREFKKKKREENRKKALENLTEKKKRQDHLIELLAEFMGLK